MSGALGGLGPRTLPHNHRRQVPAGTFETKPEFQRLQGDSREVKAEPFLRITCLISLPLRDFISTDSASQFFHGRTRGALGAEPQGWQGACPPRSPGGCCVECWGPQRARRGALGTLGSVGGAMRTPHWGPRECTGRAGDPGEFGGGARGTGEGWRPAGGPQGACRGRWGPWGAWGVSEDPEECGGPMETLGNMEGPAGDPGECGGFHWGLWGACRGH